MVRRVFCCIAESAPDQEEVLDQVDHVEQPAAGLDLAAEGDPSRVAARDVLALQHQEHRGRGDQPPPARPPGQTARRRGVLGGDVAVLMDDYRGVNVGHARNDC